MDDPLGEAKVARRRDEALARLLKTPPKPHEDMKLGKPKAENRPRRTRPVPVRSEAGSGHDIERTQFTFGWYGWRTSRGGGQRFGGPELHGPVSVAVERLVVRPEIVAGQVDVLPAERRDVGEQFAGIVSPRRRRTSRARARYLVFHKVMAATTRARPLARCFCASRLRSRMRPSRWKHTARCRAFLASPLLSSAEAWRRSAGSLQPIEGEEGALEATDLAQRQRQTVLPWVGTEPFQDQRSAHHTRPDRGRQAQHVVPVAW